MNRIKIILIVVMVLGVCFSFNVLAQQPPVVIGLQGPLTGAEAIEGEMAKQSVETAARMVNERGGVLGGRMIKIELVDDACQPKAGALAAMKLVSMKEVVAAIATYGSSVTQPASDIYEKFKKSILPMGQLLPIYQRGIKVFLPYLW